ncbi:Platelet-activating factor acetylhydrolase, isoform II [Fontibacillus panacisegetis]|uniref:Platelet-activating factor acetylhydrolase, isoform II n=1 Tax=Fontibacillus panacisegetis TaxID=670482 RepID=A0A1G7GWT2_9BACL|nr:hypothetical protein [Fontibacillus panacisegetis]SDE92606.1 Platelet-activating factor acetylhydrolase, isoform II [Fontibacillus panacisegetis]
MRIFEILILAGLLLSALGLLIIKDARLRMVFPALSAVLAFIGIGTEGYRFVMTPAYILAAVLFACSLLKLFSSERRKHPVLRSFAIAAFCIFYALSVALPLLLPVYDLPKPRGKELVGTIRLDFTNPTRRDLLSGGTTAQEIAVQVWYPASDAGIGTRAHWMDNRKVASLFAQNLRLPDILGQLCLIRTNSFWNAPLSNETDKYPVILFSGGAGSFNGQNTIQMEELASQGYIVFSVSHPYDDFAVIYADGSVVPSHSTQFEALIKDSADAITEAQKQIADESSPDFYRAMLRNSKLNAENVRIWGDDMIFIADQVGRLDDGSISSMFEGRLDTENMGIFGHSFGGAAAGQAILTDNRFKAFINLDGTPFGDTVDSIIEQPFLIMSAFSEQNGNLMSESGYSQEQEDYAVITIKGTQHMNFTDLNVVLSNVGKAIGLLGTISPERQTEIMNAYIVSFFNKHLKGMQASSFDILLPEYPEITVKIIGDPF